jgi:hypothetical protein
MNSHFERHSLIARIIYLFVGATFLFFSGLIAYEMKSGWWVATPWSIARIIAGAIFGFLLAVKGISGQGKRKLD